MTKLFNSYLCSVQNEEPCDNSFTWLNNSRVRRSFKVEHERSKSMRLIRVRGGRTMVPTHLKGSSLWDLKGNNLIGVRGRRTMILTHLKYVKSLRLES